MTRKDTDTPLSLEGEGLATLLENTAAGGRVLYIGDGAGVVRLARRAERVLHLFLGQEPEEKPANVQRRKFKAGRITFRPGSFDVVVAPDLTAIPGHAEDVLLDLAEIADAGLLVVGAPFEGRRAYEDFVELVDEVLDEARIFGVDAFVGARVSELGDEDADLWVSSLSDARAPTHVFAVAGSYDEVPSSVLVEVDAPSAVSSAPDLDEVERLEDLLAEARERADVADELERELSRERARAEDAAAKVEREKARVASLEEHLAEQKVVEARLEARGEEIRELRVEVERRGTLVRDLVEELRELRRRGTGGSEEARERVLLAEARAEASALEADELRARVLELEDELRALDEKPAAAASSEEVAPSSEDLPETIRAALGERDGLALRVAHLEEALAAARSRSDGATATDERLDQLRSELMETRAKAEATRHALEAQGELVRRLQRDLAATEVALRAAEERGDHDVGEISRLRDALVEAVSLSDRAAADVAAARAELEELRLRQSKIEANEAAALESAESARSALVQAKAALIELEAKSASSNEN
jgi:hypothetical protein